MKKKHTCALILIEGVFLLLTGAFAQPSNNDICSASLLEVNSSACSGGTNAGATAVAGDPLGTCWVGGTKSHTVWYYFVAPLSGNVTVTTDHSGGGTLTDSQLAVFSSSTGTCAGTLTQVGCDDDGGITCNLCSSLKLVGLTPGATYFVELDGYSNNTGTFCIDVHDGGPVLPNDNCENAQNLWVGSSCYSYNQCTYTSNPVTVTATSEAWETAPACWTQGTSTLSSVWFKFTAVSASTTLQIPAVSLGNNPHAAIYTGSCGSFTLVACQEDKGGLIPASLGVDLTFATTIGQTYYIQYESDNASSCNDICLTGSGGLSTPANNDCASAVALTMNTSISGNTFMATADGSFTCGTTENSLWYKFTPATTGTYYVTLLSQSGCMNGNSYASSHTGFYTANLQMSVFNTAACVPSTATEISCTSNLNTNDIDLTMTLTGGSTYLIMVDGFGGSACEFGLQVSNSRVLPVSMLYFTGRSEASSNLLEWATASELNNDYFIVERSADGMEFTPAGRVKGKGTSSVRSAYAFADTRPLPGLSYYRLRQVDYNGEVHYPAQTISLSRRESYSSRLSVYPNPGNGTELYVKMSGGKTPEEVSITDVYGREACRSREGDTDESGRIVIGRRLEPGIYLVTALAGEEKHIQKLIVK
jgi:hypothetical protein